MLLLHHGLRFLMHQAAVEEDLDPDRLSFSHAVEVVQQAVHEFALAPLDEHPALMERLLADMRHPLLPERRLRCNPRVVKSRQSKFPVRRLEHRQVPKLDQPFSDVIVLLTQSLRYRKPLPLKRFPQIALLI